MLSERRFQAIVHALLWRESPDGLQICLHQRQQTGVMDGYWVCPGGRLAAGERPAVSVRREIREELGVELVNPRLIGLLTFAMPTRFGNQVDQTTGVNYVFATNCWRGDALRLSPICTVLQCFSVLKLCQIRIRRGFRIWQSIFAAAVRC